MSTRVGTGLDRAASVRGQSSSCLSHLTSGYGSPTGISGSFARKTVTSEWNDRRKESSKSWHPPAGARVRETPI